MLAVLLPYRRILYNRDVRRIDTAVVMEVALVGISKLMLCALPVKRSGFK